MDRLPITGGFSVGSLIIVAILGIGALCIAAGRRLRAFAKK